MQQVRRAIYLLVVPAIMLMTGCSAHKNTAKSRFWQSFTAKYNTYYNGSLAFIEGSLEKEKGNKDNYTEPLPLYAVGNKQSRDIGKGQFDRSIEKMEKTIKLHSIKARPEWNKTRRKTAKDREWLGRREYNPFLWKAWLLMGKAQFQKGAFDEAAATFSYMSRLYQTQPMQYALARAWLAKSYVELDWIYDAEDVIRNMNRDSMHYRSIKDWEATYADYYLHTGELEKAATYLRKVIGHERRKTQKAREWFLMGQIQAQLGNQEQAYKAFRNVIRQNPPYELEFNARIAQTEVMAKGQSRQMISRLRRMARNDNNKDYLEQVYYAIGNIYLSQQDTLRAIAAYEQGNEKATRAGIEKGVLLLKLGNLYWEREKYNDAQRCYGEAIGLLDKERPDYEALSNRSKVLDELVPYTDAVYLQDSLQQLAKMPEAERLKAIDRVIDELKRKEKEERDKALEAEVEQQLQKRGATGNLNQRQTTPATPAAGSGNGQWYFYNQVAVNQGKQTFQRQWGKRENVDNWQRINQTVVRFDTPTENPEAPDDQDNLDNAEPTDSLAAQEGTDTPEGADSLAADPHNREYYLAQIPFTEEQLAESDNIIKDGLFHSGVIFKDKLDNLRLSEKQLLRLTRSYSDFEQTDEVWYHLFLLYSRLGQYEEAERCVERLKADFADSQWTTLLTDPYFEENARFGAHIEDSLYAATYEAFRHDRHDEVEANARLSAERFPLGENRAKFIFIDGLSQLNNGDGNGCLEQMKTVVEKYPKSEVSEMAGMIIKGVQEGRPLHGGKFDLGDVWSRRDITLATTDSTATDTLSEERNTNFLFILAYNPDSLGGPGLTENQLLFEMARHNFTNFLVRNFDIQLDGGYDIRRMTVSGFLSYDEALQYARQLYSDAPGQLDQMLRHCRTIIISEQNLPLIGTRYSYDDYDQFYERIFVPMKISDEELLNIPTDIVQPDEDEAEGDDEQEEDDGPWADDDFDLDFF
ncbi:MAG: tetratricopeptide repeat protein [Prevotella sp.]|nr:tetratricopeptide repeat protein [Prevotella sp.]